MLTKLDNPHLHPRIIHIAGTNGKGSTLVTLEKLLLDSGFSTGSTISPHLISFNERFRINGVAVEDPELDKTFEEVCQACDIDLSLKHASSRDGTISPTFFEFSIAMAFVLFRRFAVDYILLETGLGGRLDATNVVPTPLACVLTRIAIDHQEYLGNTIEEIVQEKLGILKQGSPVFAASQEENVRYQIVNYCKQQDIKVFYSPVHFGYRVLKNGSTDYYHTVNNGRISEVDGFSAKICNQALIGEHQKENTATAIAVYRSIVPKDHILNNYNFEKSLNSVIWSGRLQYLGKERKILIDGAHNSSGFQRLLHYLNTNHAADRILFAIGWKKDKHLFSDMSQSELRRFQFLPLQMESEYSETVEEILNTLKDNGLNTLESITVSKLLDRIEGHLMKQYDLIVVSGSLYLVGEFLKFWTQKYKPSKQI
ncbi:hypothetical protein KJ966_24165 [bacterium]|nr:hypothetical protein [bacterium]